MTYDVLFFSGQPITDAKMRSAGPHVLKNVLDSNNLSTLVVDFIDYLKVDEYFQILSKTVGKNTKAIGFSVSWLIMDLDDRLVNSIQHEEEKEDKFSTVNEDYLGFAFAKKTIHDILKRTRQLYPHVKIFAGGPRASLITEEEYPEIDNIFLGYSETMIIDYLTEDREFPFVLSYDFKAHADHTNFDFKYSSTTYDENSFILPNEVLGIQYARGCRFKCSFCSFPLIGMKDVATYTKDPDVLKDDLLRNYEKWGVTKYTIADETFNDSTPKLEEFANIVQQLPFQPTFWAFTRADIVVKNPIQIDILDKIGLAETWVGVETFTRAAGQAIGKGGDPLAIKEMLYEAKKVWGKKTIIELGLIVGLPNESTEDFEENTVKWLLKPDCPVDMARINPLLIVPPFHTDSKNMLFLSDIDRNYQEYGYSFPHNDPSKKHIWAKDDGTDINSYSDALDLANDYLYVKQPPLGENYPGIFNTTLDYRPFNNYRELMCADAKTQKDAMAAPRKKLAYLEIRNKYVKPLIESL